MHANAKAPHELTRFKEQENTMESFVQIKPGKRYLTRAYLAVMLWFVGKAIQAAARADKEVADEFSTMPDGYTFSLGAYPNGPYMVVGKNDKGRVRYLGSNIDRQPVHLQMTLKSTGHLFTLFTFRESTPTANARDRLFVLGDVPHACTVTRILNIVQVYLLAKPVAKLAIKRYPDWPLSRHIFTRAMVLTRTVTGI